MWGKCDATMQNASLNSIYFLAKQLISAGLYGLNYVMRPGDDQLKIRFPRGESRGIL